MDAEILHALWFDCHDLSDIERTLLQALAYKHGQSILYTSAEITGSYPVRINSKSHNCCAETGKRA